MAEFLHIALSFPTVIFSALLLATFFYWMLVIVGAIGLDILDGMDAGDGAIEGAADGALDGAIEGAADGALDGAIEGAADGALDAGGEGLLEGIGESAEGLEVADLSSDGGLGEVPDGAMGASVIAGLFAFLRIGQVPMTVVLSCLILWGWLFTFIAHSALLKTGFTGLPALLLGGGAAVGGLMVSMLFTSLLMRPLAKLFEHHTQHGEYQLVGSTCTILSQRVSERSGRAEFQDGGAGLILEVRSSSGHSLHRDDEVLIVEYIPEENVYIVEPLGPRVPKDSDKQVSRVKNRTDSSRPLSEG